MMNDQKWVVSFYNDKVQKEVYDLPIDIRADLARTIDIIEQIGPNLGRPHSVKVFLKLGQLVQKELHDRYFVWRVEKKLLSYSLLLKNRIPFPIASLNWPVNVRRRLKNETSNI